MRAWIHAVAGPPSGVLSLSSNVATPTIKEDTDVLVRVSHAALNPAGSIMMQLCPFVFRSKSAIPELDFSGTLMEAGSKAVESGRVAIGDAVFGSVEVGKHIKESSGSLGEYIVVPVANVARKPSNASEAEAAGLGVAGCTAIELVDNAGLQQGNSVLVNGASGGIGSMVVQMSRGLVKESGRVVAICSGRNRKMVEALGVDEVIDYQAYHPISKYLAKHYSERRFDVVIDAYGVQDLYSHCSGYLKPGGRFVTVGVAHRKYTYLSMLAAVCRMTWNILTSLLPGPNQRRYVQVNAAVNVKAVDRLQKMVEQGRLRVPVDSCWEMKDALKAYETLLSRRARGKVVVRVQEE